MAASQASPVRLQEYGVGIFTACPTKSALKKKLNKGLVRVNGSIASTATFICGGEEIELLREQKSVATRTLKLPLKVLYEDDSMAAIYKPAGIQVSGNKFKTIANALIQNLSESPLADGCAPQPAHRLDFPTTGVLLVGKTSTAIRVLNQMFEEKRVLKTYLAVSMGEMNLKKGVFTEAVDEKKAITDYEVIESVPSKRFGCLNLLRLLPKTGRRHQIRKHLSGSGTAILGDADYSPDGFLLKGKGLYLHAYSVELKHPFTGEKLSIKAEVPEKFRKIFEFEF